MELIPEDLPLDLNKLNKIMVKNDLPLWLNKYMVLKYKKVCFLDINIPFYKHIFLY